MNRIKKKDRYREGIGKEGKVEVRWLKIPFEVR